MANHYIDNKEFEKFILDYQTAKADENSKEKAKELESELTVLFYRLADNILRGFKFQLIDKEDALQEGVMICFLKLDRFETSKGDAFNYYTTCILNHYRQLYRGAKVYNELKRKYQDHIVDKMPDIFSSTVNDNHAKLTYRKKHDEI